MTTRLSRERALTSALDHLHTPATELARFASKAPDSVAPSGPVPVAVSDPSHLVTAGAAPSGARVTNLQRRRAEIRRARPSRLRRVGASIGAVVLLGSTALAGSVATATTDPAANSVLAFGAAPKLGPDSGLALRAGVIDIVSNPVGSGYWLAASDGGVFAFGDAPFLGSTGAADLTSPIVGMAAVPDGKGYWLVASDGGVFTFGDAAYYGATAGLPLHAPITSIVANPDGGGYWLVASDGRVFGFGDAPFLGSTEGLGLASPIVAAAATKSGSGYWLLGTDGGVFSFGDAPFAGALPDPSHPAVGIAASPAGSGYWIAHADGNVTSFNVPVSDNPPVPTTESPRHMTVAIAASSAGGYWLAQGATEAASPLANDPFLACTRAYESNSSGGYRAISSGGTYRGAYQFDRGTWNSAAHLAARPDLVGIDPAAAAPADQDLLAFGLFHSRGTRPWGGRCRGIR